MLDAVSITEPQQQSSRSSIRLSEIDIERWEDQMRKYDEAESNYMDSISQQPSKHIELGEMLSSLRNNPQQYLTHAQKNLRELAAMRCRIEKYGGRLNHKPFDPAEQKQSQLIQRENPILSSSAVSQEIESSDTFSNRVSQRWARNLHSVIPTQGRLRTSVQERNLLRTRPKWPEWLVDESFQVIKRNEYGKRLPRILLLTEFHILMASKEAGVTKVYAYSDVRSIECKLSPPGEERLSIRFKSDNRLFVLLSSVAQVITQQVTTRVKVRESLALIETSIKSSVRSTSDSPDAISYSPLVLESIIKSISEQSSSSSRATPNVLSFARSLLDRVVPDREAPMRNVQSDGVNFRRRSTRVDRPPDKPTFDEPSLSTRLLVVEKSSGDYAVIEEVRRGLYDMRSPEGNTRRHFVETFDPHAQGSAEVRLWIEGMHEYLLLNKGASLAQIMRPQESAAISAQADPAVIISNSSISTESDEEKTLASLRLLPEADLLTLSYLIFATVEEALFSAVMNGVIASLPCASDSQRETALVRRWEPLKKRTQSEWGIPEAQQSPLLYRTAVFQLRGIEQYPTPSKRLNAVVSAVDAIFSEYALQASARATSPSSAVPVLGADDLVPIFIFVLCQCDLQTPLQNKDLLWSLCHPDQLYGSAGYYLTVYESAVAYVESLVI